MELAGVNQEAFTTKLCAMSHAAFDIVSLGGIVGPSRNFYDRHRPEGFPKSRTLLRALGFPLGADGWGGLLSILGFTPPTDFDTRLANEERMELVKNAFVIDQECISDTPLGDGWHERTTKTLYLLR